MKKKTYKIKSFYTLEELRAFLEETQMSKKDIIFIGQTDLSWKLIYRCKQIIGGKRGL